LANPVLVELTRGDIVESVHRGAVAITDAEGRLILSLGEVEAPVYPRSSLKPIQAIPLLESGAADAFGLNDEHIALACASHSGEAMHTTRVAAWLARIGLAESDLASGPQAVRYEPLWREMIRRGELPGRVHNNCSGKHAGFLTVARHWGVATAGYERHDHPVQQAVARVLGELSGVSPPLPWGVDGCAAPNFALPLAAFARGLARIADPASLDEPRFRAARRIMAAMTAHPDLVAGTGRTCTILMRGARAPFAVKTGAEGVYAGMIPGRGLGVALKIDDGAGRAAETAIAAVLDGLDLLGKDQPSRAVLRAPILNTRDAVVGERRPAAAFVDAVKRAMSRRP
jgi:L-asparaginase II